jgi:hypothetical protein
LNISQENYINDGHFLLIKLKLLQLHDGYILISLLFWSRSNEQMNAANLSTIVLTKAFALVIFLIVVTNFSNFANLFYPFLGQKIASY